MAEKNMNKKIALLVIGAIIIFVLGVVLGFFITKMFVVPVAQQQTPTDQNAKTLKMLSSKVVPLYANGIVTKIDGMNVTLTSYGDSLVVPISITAKINLFVQPTGGKSPYYQPVQLSSIKTGDRLNINLELTPGNKLEGKMVYIFPSTSGGPAKNF